MTLPLTRNRTRSLADPVKSADINDLDDMIIGARHGSITVPIDCFSGIIAAGAPALSGSYWVAAGATDAIYVGLRLPVGTTITSLSLYGYQQGATPISWQLRELLTNATDNLLESNAGGPTTGDRTLTTAMSRTIAAGKMYYLIWDAGQALDSLYFFDIDIQK